MFPKVQLFSYVASVMVAETMVRLIAKCCEVDVEEVNVHFVYHL